MLACHNQFQKHCSGNHLVGQSVKCSTCLKHQEKHNPSLGDKLVCMWWNIICHGGIGVYAWLHSGCTMFVVLDDWPVSKFIDNPLGSCIFKKIIVLLWYHAMHSWECFACPIIDCPCKAIDWHCYQYLIHFACFFAQFVSVWPRMLILWSLSMFLGGSGMSCWRWNWSLTISA